MNSYKKNITKLYKCILIIYSYNLVIKITCFFFFNVLSRSLFNYGLILN